jgi:PAS domain S-box-containing protein
MNTLFLGIIPIVIAYVTFKVYTKSGSASVLLIGSGILIFGLGSIVAGWVNPLSGGPNMTVTLHNTCACIGSILIFAGAVMSHTPSKSGKPTGNTGTIAAAYTAIVVFVTIFSLATLQGMIPPFFVPGSGPTVLRQVILENATALFALSSVLFMVTYRKGRSDFFFWYSVAFALIAIGLLAVFVQPSVGSLIGWVGRSAQYIGFVFALYAVLIARKTATAKGLPLEDVIANFFVDAEQSYKQLVETATDAIVTIDEDYRVLLWNSAAERMFGYPRDDAIGASFLKLVIDDPYIAVIKNNKQDISGRDIPVLTPEPVEIVGKRKSGAFFPVELTVSQRWQEGRLIQTCILRDITERKVAEEALYMSLVMDGVPTQFSYVDADLRFVYVNKAYAEWYGKTINEFKGKSIRDVKGDEVFLQDLPHYQMALSGKPVSFERIIPDTEGKEHFVIITLVPHFKGERVIGFFASIMDITERKVAEDALRESEYNLKDAQRVGHLGSWDLNVVTGDLLWSDECYRIYGFRPQEFVPTFEKFQQIVHPEDRGFVQEQVDAALNNNKHYDLDFRFLRYNGETGWIHVEGEVTRDTEGKPIRFFGTQIDITERKRAEEALARKHEEMNAAYEQLTASEEVLQVKYAELASSQSSLRETTNYLNNLLDYANAPIIVWDPSQRITRFNHAFERLTGRTSNEVVGQPLEILFPPPE